MSTQTKTTPPMLPGLPLIGHALEFRRDHQALFRRGLEELGPVFAIRLGRQPAAVMIGPAYHKQFFLETDKALSMHKAYSFLAAMFGKIAFAAPPDVYRKQRPILHLPFKREKMLRYVEVMQEEVQRWLDSLGDAGEMDLPAEMNKLVQAVAAHALMGRAFHQRMGQEFWDLYQDLSAGLDPLLPPNLPLPKFRRRDRAKAKMRAMLKPILAERRQNPEQYDDFLQDFVNARYEDGSEVEEETILGLLLGLMFAGHETTSGQAAWSIIHLLQHPDYLALAQAEIEEFLPPGARLSASLLNQLEKINWAVQESGRLRPSADMLMRYVDEEMDIGSHRLPAGWLAVVAPAVAHRQPDLFDQPDAYDPLRFAPGRQEDRQDRFALIGFGGGAHKCTGMNFAVNEMMVIIALLFQQFELELLTPNPKVSYGLGAGRPDSGLIRYRRRVAQSKKRPRPEQGQ